MLFARCNGSVTVCGFVILNNFVGMLIGSRARGGRIGAPAGREPWKMAGKFSQEAHAHVEQWREELQEDRARAKERNAMLKGGGRDVAGRDWEGRRVGIDFYTSPRGPPGDLKLAKDVGRHGKQGLAGEYAGDRNKDNPWEWDCQWQEMAIPAETRNALAREKKMGKGGRIVYDMGIYPAAKKAALEREAEILQKEANLERGKLLQAYMEQAVLFEKVREDVFEGRIKWERRNGRWLVAGDLGGNDLVILAAQKGADMLNQTPFNFDRPEGRERPYRLHEMLSQLIRAPTIRDPSKTPPPNPPYAWPAEGSNGKMSGGAPRQEWDIRSLMRGERRTVAERRNAWERERASEEGIEGERAGRRASGVGAEREGGEEREEVRSVLVRDNQDGVYTFKVFHPGGKRWDGSGWREVAPAMITVRHHPNRHLGLNRRLLAPTLAERPPELEGLSPSEVEMALQPSTKEVEVFHHLAQLAPGAMYRQEGREMQLWHGGSVLPPDRRLGVVEADGVLGGASKFGDCGVLGGDGKLLGRRWPNVDGAGLAEEEGVARLAHVRRAGNHNYGLNRQLLNPEAPAAGERVRLVDCGDGRVEAAFPVALRRGAQRRPYARDDLRSAGANNTFCQR